jgi:hypothetical protein
MTSMNNVSTRGSSTSTTHRKGSARWIRSAVLFALIVAASSAASATTLLKKNLDDLIRESDAIVVGTVTAVQAERAASGDLHSFVTLTDLQVIHGEYYEAGLTLRLEGGRVGQDVRVIIGSPRFQANERVLLFIHGNGQYFVPLVGWTQGVFRLTLDAGTGKDRVFDHDRNPVLAIRGSEVVKRRIHPAATEIVGGTPSAGDAALDVVDALDADAFLAEVGRRAGRIGARGRTLRSVAPMPDERRP